MKRSKLIIAASICVLGMGTVLGAKKIFAKANQNIFYLVGATCTPITCSLTQNMPYCVAATTQFYSDISCSTSSKILLTGFKTADH